MKGFVCFLMIIFCMAGAVSYAQQDELVTLAKEFVELMSKEDFSGAVERFDSVMKNALPESKLRDAWKSVIAQVGSFKGQIGYQTQKIQVYDIVLVTCKFERANLDVKVVFNKEKQVTGLWFLPSQTATEAKPPEYADRSSFREMDVMVGKGEWALPGILSVPRDGGTFPAVVLVHGSGPNDRDETVGPNKPFRDLAWGLASRGIVVLRYEKRTKEHSSKLALTAGKITVKEETIDDAIAAVSTLHEMSQVDDSRIFVLGHSLGGMLIPRIGALDPEIAGFIVMAGTTRPLEDVYLEQMTYAFSIDGAVSDDEKAQLEKIKQQVARVKDPKLSVFTSAAELPLGVPAAYWLDLRGYDPAEIAKNLKQPMLILQGEREYQVTMEDFQNWKNALSDRKNVEFKSYPKLNHLFITGEGKCTPAEYQNPGNVAEMVVEDIANWIKKQ